MSEFLFTLWAGGGNVSPQLVLARRLATRGHTVRVLAPAALRRHIEEGGLLYEPYRRAPQHDESVPEQSLIRDFEHRLPIRAAATVRDNLLAGTAGPIAADTLDVLEHRPIDVVAFDYMLFGALFAAEKSGLPAAMLVHNVYPFPAPGRPPFTMGWVPMGGPLGPLRDALGWSMFRLAYERPLLPTLNRVRAELGLSPVPSLEALLTRPERIFVLTSRAFDFPGQLPANASYIGAQVEDPAWTPEWKSPWAPDDARPLVIVGLTTTYQGHRQLLEKIVSALGRLPVRGLVSTGSLDVADAPANVHLAVFVPHARVLPEAAAVVTHAGLGTVHAALASGRPLVCLPLGRDQPDNAARVVWHGAGVRVSPRTSPSRIAEAIDRVLHDDAIRSGAARLATKLAADRAEHTAPDALEELIPQPKPAASAASPASVASATPSA